MLTYPLVSIKAGNAGLNLWKASRVIILDPFWNPFIEEQAVDRAHRMPQPREVHVYRILIPETVEDRIKQLQDKKLDVINSALDENASKSLTRLSKNELKFLFGMH
jgi:SNF2 family DNA or RNA helicase